MINIVVIFVVFISDDVVFAAVDGAVVSVVVVDREGQVYKSQKNNFHENVYHELILMIKFSKKFQKMIYFVWINL